METIQEEKLLHRIQKLIDKAASTEHPEEADAFMRKADALMMQHSIDEIRLQQRRVDQPSVFSQEPEWRDISVWAAEGPTDTTFVGYLQDLFYACAGHWTVKARMTYGNEGRGRVAQCVGFPSDLHLLEIMWTQLKLHAMGSLNPKVDPSKPWQESMAALKDTGLKWQRIHERLRDAHPDYPYDQMWERKIGVRFTSEYKKIAERDGRTRNMTSSPQTWRDDYIYGYVKTIRERMRQARAASSELHDNLPALLKDKGDVIQEAWWVKFPDQRPHPEDCECSRCEAYREALKSAQGKRLPMGRVRYRNSSAMARGSSRAATADLGGSKVSGGARKEIA